MSALENRIPPPVVFMIAALAMSAGAYTTPYQPFLPQQVRFWVSLALFLLAAVGPLAIFAFSRAKTTVDPVNIERASKLVTSGVFNITRNPMYLSMALLLTGLSVALGWPWALLGPALFVLYITRFQIIPEERMLTAKFGADYIAYRSRVRRWL